MSPESWKLFYVKLPNQDHKFSQTQLGIIYHMLETTVDIHGNGEFSTSNGGYNAVRLHLQVETKEVEICMATVAGKYDITDCKINSKPTTLKTALGYYDTERIKEQYNKDQKRLSWLTQFEHS